jgi:hypothetical protein
MMRTVTVSQSSIELDSATEALLFNALEDLERHCDSLLRCRVEIQREYGAASGQEPWRVKLLLGTGEHDIFVEGRDDCAASTPGQAILNAIQEAEVTLLGLKAARKCTVCSDQLAAATAHAN